MKFSKFKIVEGTYIVLALAYSIYGFFTGTGLSGWMTKLQFDLFGAAYDKLTVILTMMLLLIPLGIVRYLLEKKNLIEKRSAKNDEPFDAAVWIKNLSAPMLAALLAAALLPAISGYGIYSYYYALNQEKLQEKIDDVDLNQDSGVEVSDQHYVHLHGKLNEDYTYVVEKEIGYSKNNTQAERYTPLTAENWDESKPIQFVYYSQGLALPSAMSKFRREPQTVFDGEITDMTLPVYVRSEYEKIGLKLAENVTVVRSEYFTDGKIRDNFRESYSHIFLYGGIALSALIIFLLLVWKVQPIKGNER